VKTDIGQTTLVTGNLGPVTKTNNKFKAVNCATETTRQSVYNMKITLGYMTTVDNDNLKLSATVTVKRCKQSRTLSVINNWRRSHSVDNTTGAMKSIKVKMTTFGVMWQEDRRSALILE